MQWENLTVSEFERAVKETGVCLVAMGVIEKHGEHLPLGTDFLNGHKIASLAAEKEPAVVFPPFYFGQIYEARCFPGTVTLPPSLLVELVESVLDEIARNGFRKIVLVNAHGGNTYFLRFLAQATLWEEKDYVVYVYDRMLTPEAKAKWDETLETSVHGHACECETSVTMANYPELVRMDLVPEKPAEPQKRLAGTERGFTALNWYSNFPAHYAGDARAASAEKGRTLRGLLVDSLAEFIAAVKADSVLPALNLKFARRVQQVSSED